jgi:hypothetical protein
MNSMVAEMSRQATGGVLFVLGLILWAIFFPLDMWYKKRTPVGQVKYPTLLLICFGAGLVAIVVGLGMLLGDAPQGDYP